jgi:hypothetical protein
MTFLLHLKIDKGESFSRKRKNRFTDNGKHSDLNQAIKYGYEKKKKKKKKKNQEMNKEQQCINDTRF